MKAFTCTKCGNVSLVRSNFRLSPDRTATCRGTDQCDARAKKRAQERAETAAMRVRGGSVPFHSYRTSAQTWREGGVEGI